MSTDDPTTTTEPPEDEQPTWARELRQANTKLKKERDEALAEAQTFRRRDAFDNAGIPNEGPGKLLRDSYDGELDAEAIKAKALEYGIVEPPPPPEPSVPASELDAHRRASEATGVSEPSPDYFAKLEAATSPDEVEAAIREAGGVVT